MKNATNHIFATEYEGASNVSWIVGEDDLLCDIKKLLSEYYIAAFSAKGKSLNISFNNGQRFCVSVKETTERSA